MSRNERGGFSGLYRTGNTQGVAVREPRRKSINDIPIPGADGTLILTRKVGEFTYLLYNGVPVVKIGVLGVKGNQVSIGYLAPKTIEVVRAELMAGWISTGE